MTMMGFEASRRKVQTEDSVSGNALFTRFYRSVYDTYLAPCGIPFSMETGAGNGQKEGWL